MPSINLLPWREAKRAQIKKQFVGQLIAGFGIVCLIALLIHFTMASLIDNQSSRNTYLQEQMGGLMVKIRQANQFKQEHQALLMDLQRINQFTQSRADAVKLFEALETLTPDGLYLTGATRQGDKFILSGVALSNDQINLLLENTLKSALFQKPVLDNIQLSSTTNQFKRAFTLTLQMPLKETKEIAK